jgi:hypothetical protein
MSSAKAITQHLDNIAGKDGVSLEEFFKNIGHHDKQERFRFSDGCCGAAFAQSESLGGMQFYLKL